MRLAEMADVVSKVGKAAKVARAPLGIPQRGAGQEGPAERAVAPGMRAKSPSILSLLMTLASKTRSPRLRLFDLSTQTRPGPPVKAEKAAREALAERVRQVVVMGGAAPAAALVVVAARVPSARVLERNLNSAGP